MTGTANTNIVSASWIQNGQTWSLQYSDGTVPVNSWVCVAAADGAHWYHFNAEGQMQTSWVDMDGKRYYFTETVGGTEGRMATGWQQIGEKWYYFSSASDATLGMLLTNTTTPDGYQVDANGEWIQ